jgi:hypothetical protein
MVIDFITYPSLNGQNLLIEDTSVDFGGVAYRKIKIKDSTNVEAVIDFPIVDGTGDILTYLLVKDKVFTITLETDLGSITKDVAIIYRAGKYLESKLDNLANSGMTAVTQLSNTDLKNYMWRELLMFTVENYTAEGNIQMGQKALDTLNNISEDLKGV